MVRLDEQRKLIEDVEAKIHASKSYKERNDLRKYKNRLIKELKEAEEFLNGART